MKEKRKCKRRRKNRKRRKENEELVSKAVVVFKGQSTATVVEAFVY